MMGGTSLVGSLLGARFTDRVQLNTLIRAIGLFWRHWVSFSPPAQSGS